MTELEPIVKEADVLTLKQATDFFSRLRLHGCQVVFSVACQGDKLVVENIHIETRKDL